MLNNYQTLIMGHLPHSPSRYSPPDSSINKQVTSSKLLYDIHRISSSLVLALYRHLYLKIRDSGFPDISLTGATSGCQCYFLLKASMEFQACKYYTVLMSLSCDRDYSHTLHLQFIPTTLITFVLVRTHGFKHSTFLLTQTKRNVLEGYPRNQNISWIWGVGIYILFRALSIQG